MSVEALKFSSITYDIDDELSRFSGTHRSKTIAYLFALPVPEGETTERPYRQPIDCWRASLIIDGQASGHGRRDEELAEQLTTLVRE